LPPCFTLLLDLVHTSHFLACHLTFFQHFTRHQTPTPSLLNSSAFHSSSGRDSGSCYQVLRASGLVRACLHIRDWTIVILPVRLTNNTHASLGHTASLPQSCRAQKMISRSSKVRHVLPLFASVTQLFSQSVCFLTKSRASGDLVKILFQPHSELLARLHRSYLPCSLAASSFLPTS
jgi:hypothetical protein